MLDRLILDTGKYAELGAERIAMEIGRMPEVQDVELLDDGRIAISYDAADMDELFLNLPRHIRGLDKALDEMREAAAIAEVAPARQTVVVNVFGGPGAGKTTAAHEIVAALSKRGYVVEYAPEYAKELAWAIDNENCSQEEQREARKILDGSLRNQAKIYEEQRRRVDVLIGKCDFVVTDSPTILSCIYLEEKDDVEAARQFREAALEDFKLKNNFNMVVKREGAYQEQGRIHTEEQARRLDGQIKDYLNSNGIYHGTYKRSALATALVNMEKNLVNVRQAAERELFPDPAKLKAAPGRDGVWSAKTQVTDVELAYHGDDGWTCSARVDRFGLSEVTLADTAKDAFEQTRAALGNAIAQDEGRASKVALPGPRLTRSATRRLERLQNQVARAKAPAENARAAKPAVGAIVESHRKDRSR